MPWILATVLLVLGGCTHAPVRDPAVAQDVMAYVAKIKNLEPVEAKVLRTIRDLRQSQFVDDDYVIATITEVMDDIQLHLEEIARYQQIGRAHV